MRLFPRPQRAALLHEGSGLAVLNAYVEITFDNSDGRMPIDKEEVVLRRTIGLKKDEYYLDNKRVTRADVVNLLESAGFSRSNPYYIVQQGKIQDLTKMNNAGRLNLLKEVAGTKVYDERRDESTKIMADTEARKAQIEESIATIETRLKELDDEKEELAKFQELDRDRRCVEYAIYEHESRDAGEHLEELDRERDESSNTAESLHADSLRVFEEIKDAEKLYKGMQTEMETHQREKEAIEEDRSELLRSRAKLELDVKDLEEAAKSGKSTQATAAQRIEQLEQEIDVAQGELAAVLPKYEAELAKEHDTKDRVAALEAHVASIYARGGRATQFKTQADRDKWIRAEVKKAKTEIADKKRRLQKEEESVEKLRGDIERETQEIEKASAAVEKHRNDIDVCNVELKNLQAARDVETNARKDAWRADAELEASVQNARSELAKKERQLSSSVPKSLSQGLAAVRRLVESKKVKGVYGPLIDLLEVDDPFMTAVEVSAGNSLFHIVVDNEATATHVLDLMKRDRIQARLTFMPLAQLRPDLKKAPDSVDLLPLMDKLTFDPMYEKAFQQVFGKVIVARNAEVAASAARQYDFNCVTLEGDQVNRKGVLTGGFYDTRKSRMETAVSIRKLRAQLADDAEQLEGIKAVVAKHDDAMAKVMGEVQKQEALRSHLRTAYEQGQADIKMLTPRVAAHKDALKLKEATVHDLGKGVELREQDVASLESELGTALTDGLGEKEQAELAKLNKEVEALNEELLQLSKSRGDLEKTKNDLDQLLNSNLLRRKAELEAQMQTVSMNAEAGNLDGVRASLDSVLGNIAVADEKLSEAEKAIAELTKGMAEARAQIDALKEQDKANTAILQSRSKTMDKLLNNRALFTQRREEALQKIRNLGSLPATAFDGPFTKLSQKELLKKLKSLNDKLAKYSHVNKKALDQYMSFTGQRDQLILRKKEMDAGNEAIAEMIKTLDQRKNEAIERTFQGAAKNFQNVFSELVPQGKAKLVMQTREKQAEELTLDEEAGTGKNLSSAVDKYTGIAIHVSFTGVGEHHLISQLSGGQKSVVALALVFAIQRCDPAPFYLFDEVDAALDANYRHAIASLIQKQAQNGIQFLTTTFRTELVESADKCYSVSYHSKVSRVDVIDQERAIELVTKDESENAAAIDAAR